MVEAVVYGAVRGPQRIGDVILERAMTFGATFRRDLVQLLTPTPDRVEPATLQHTRAAIAELTGLAKTSSDAARQSAIYRLVAELHDVLKGEPVARSVRASQVLAPRKVEVLGLVAVGMTNLEVAVELGLAAETVRAYLRSAMRKLGVRNRTEAVHVARQVGAL